MQKRLPPATNARKSATKRLSTADAKAQVLERISEGYKVEEAMFTVERKLNTYLSWRKEDPTFRQEVDEIRSAKAQLKETGRPAVPDFPEFCAEWLKQPLFEHQLRGWEAIQGNEPTDLHQSMGYYKGDVDRVLLNFPPDHCPSVDTLVPTTTGMKLAGEIKSGDYVFDQHGLPTEVIHSEEHPPESRQFVVTFNTGDSFQVDASHLWLVRDLTKGSAAFAGEMTTEYRTDQLLSLGIQTRSGQNRWRVDNAPVAQHAESRLSVDPYVFGYWLGDGDSNGSRLAVGEQDLNDLLSNLDRAGYSYSVAPQRGGHSVYVKGIRKFLPLGDKHIPVEYLTGTEAQRRALLQGLMDSDGTISEKDGRAKFCQQADRDELIQNVYQLIASLGYQPRLKTYKGRTKLPQGGFAASEMSEVAFIPGTNPAFRLVRKSSRQKPLHKSHSQRRTIVSIDETVDRKPVQQITVASVGGSILLGAGHIISHNAKSTTYCVNLVVWLIHKNPSINVVIMSQSSKLAERFLGEIKFKLTAPMFRDMHLRFAPEGGWKDPDRSWTNDAIYVQGKDGRKDPTVQALGLSGQIYGTRADLIILDDIITTKNNREIDKQMILIEREVESRLPSEISEKRLPDEFPGTGLLLVLGTRVAPVDLYRELIDLENFYDERVWTYLRQPAVLDYGNGEPENWSCLWPERWDGKSLARRRRSEASWALIYQQLNVTDNMTFKAEAVEASVNGGRFAGPLTVAGKHHREGGMQGLYVIGGLDPATTGATAMIVYGLDAETGKRYILDGFNRLDCPPHVMREKIQYFTEVYNINEWVIERNAYQRAITQDKDLIAYLRSRGCRLTEHTTGTNKYDSDFGIATMGPLFDTCGTPNPKNPSGRWDRTPETALIELPSKYQNDWCSVLVQELIVWQPEGMAQKTKTDLVMALWFCEIAAKRILYRGKKKQHFRDAPFMSEASMKKRKVISLSDIKRARLEAELLDGTG